MKYFFNFKHIKGDLFGGITAGIVALPLALAFGDASGMGAIAGLYGAMVIGFFAALFGGTPTQVSGPTGPMFMIAIPVISGAIATMGSLEAAMPIIVATFMSAGLFLVMFGLLKLGKYIKYIPYPVLSGFMSGIGVIIILFQLYLLMGHETPKSTWEVLVNIGGPLSAINWSAMGLGATTVAIIYVLPKFTKVVPSTLVALVVGTATAYYLKFDVPVIGDIPTGLPTLKLDGFLNIDINALGDIVKYGLILAGLGAIDSLLTSVIADNVTKTKHNSDKELIGQGIGNILSGMIGGLPGAGATMRTVVNVNAGGKTKISGMIHGLFLFAILMGLGPLAAEIPKSVLAGILLTVGIGIIDYKGIKHVRHVPISDAVIMVVVLVISVFGSLMVAVGVGMVLASVIFMKKMGDLMGKDSKVGSMKDFKKETPWNDEKGIPKLIEEKIYIKHLDGPLFFGFASDFSQMLRALPEVKLVIIRMAEVPFVDQSGLYAMEDAILDLKTKGIVVVMTGIKDQPLDMLRRINVVPGLIPETLMFSSFMGCIKWVKTNFDESDDCFKKISGDLAEIQKTKVAYTL